MKILQVTLMVAGGPDPRTHWPATLLVYFVAVVTTQVRNWG